MTQAKQGDTVQIHYTGRLDDGTVFDSSEGREPLEFQLGSGMVISGFDSGVTGMSVGETRTIHIPCDEAYGQHDPSNVLEVPKAELPPDMPLEAGIQLQMILPTGQPVIVTLTEVKPDSVILDANHMLAGKDLTFDLQLVAIA